MRERWLEWGRRAGGAAVGVPPLSRLLLLLLSLVPALCLAQPDGRANGIEGAGSASAQLHLSVVVPPVFRVLQVTPAAGGYDYRVWTNMKSIVIGGREYRFDRIGENTVRVPTGPGDTWIVHGL
ncbi:hypothetical protein VLK31_27850 [Variovorax sp. H27-G14]|uniref:hypothetical protein n=1 Tax=Variovorax sp. H27-G14 TaxID=3111914 RepID=UPI0038FCD00B